jgi:hypothetical protein
MSLTGTSGSMNRLVDWPWSMYFCRPAAWMTISRGLISLNVLNVAFSRSVQERQVLDAPRRCRGSSPARSAVVLALGGEQGGQLGVDGR